MLSQLAIASLLGACAYAPYRTSGEPCTIDNPERTQRGGYDWESAGDGRRPCADRWEVSVTKPVPFSMNFVEIDEQGMLAKRAQAEAAIANASAHEGDGSYVVVFVHGWHHNASSADGNVQGFYDALALASRWNKSRKIKGIYIGWRGDSLPVPGLRYITFWDRKNTSDEVGRGGLLEFLLRLERGVKNGSNGSNRLLVVGHSFGASVTFNALAHTYLQRFLEGAHSQENKPRFRGYGDLVVLVNPAIEAMRYMPFQSAIEYYGSRTAPPRVDFSHENRPALVILSSQGDAATRIAFPAARFVSTALEAHSRISAHEGVAIDGPYSEWNLDRDTVGNFTGFQTHEPLRLSDNATDPNTPFTATLNEKCDSLGRDETWRLLNQPDDSSATAFPDSQVLVRRRSESTVMNSPFIIAAVSRQLIRDHTDIGRPNVVCWINQLLDTNETGMRTLSQVEAETQQPTP
jgi:hypothetical protein